MHVLSTEETTPLISRSDVPVQNHDDRQLRRKELAVNIILGSVLLERIAYYTLAANIALNLGTVTSLCWSRTNGLIASFIFAGTSTFPGRVLFRYTRTRIGVSCISSFIFAILSDWKLGRFATILLGYALYLSGYIFAIVNITTNYNTPSNSTSCSDKHTNGDALVDENHAGSILPMIIIISMGAGATQCNTAVFGGDQIHESMFHSRFFDKYVVAANIAAIFGMCATPFALKDAHLYRILFIIAGSALLSSALLFTIGWPFYTRIPAYDSVIVNCFPVCKNAFQSWREYNRNARIRNRDVDHSVPPRDLTNTAHSLTEDERASRLNERPPTFLDYSRIIYNGKFNDRIVDDLKSLRKALIVFILLIPYWLIYHQVNSTFRVQGHFSDTLQDEYMFTFVSLVDAVTIIVGILLLNMFVYKCVDARNRTSSIVAKLIIGMCFACVTMIIAGVGQRFFPFECLDGRSINGTDWNILPLIADNFFMGLSEIFGMLASFEFAYYAAPRSGKTLFMSFRFCSIGIASFLGAAYVDLFSIRLPKSIHHITDPKNECPYDYLYFCTLAGLQLMFIVIFIICQKKFRIIKLDAQKMETRPYARQTSTLPIE